MLYTFKSQFQKLFSNYFLPSGGLCTQMSFFLCLTKALFYGRDSSFLSLSIETLHVLVLWHAINFIYKFEVVHFNADHGFYFTDPSFLHSIRWLVSNFVKANVFKMYFYLSLLVPSSSLIGCRAIYSYWSIWHFISFFEPAHTHIRDFRETGY